MYLTEIFGSKVFNDDVMRQRLPAVTYKALNTTIKQNKRLDPEVANVVANAMKDWALENGATHFTHWFQPLNGVTAEKHDSFISPVGGGRIINEFSGSNLIHGEPDASSFPSGGIRSTFEARGYTAWDPTSYAFIKDNVLCIPTAFCSYSGEALDRKTPLLRSMQALNKQTMRVLRLFGNTDVDHIKPTAGPEQEYFLIDEEMYNQRLDLKFTGRTLYGAMPPKGQELDDHYFGVIKPRVQEFMRDLDDELWKLGILAKTEHNEVAPSQHELAPIFLTTNVAADHNQLTMEIMKKVARRHGLVCILTEKPFDGVNGSGKHNNWSIKTDTGVNLLEPGDTPHENAQFLLFLVAVIKAVDEYQDLLRISIASAGNDHRLGAQEAPPAIVSMFLGDELTEILESIDEGRAMEGKEKSIMRVGVHAIPYFHRDTTDRNRTSPFAFTGNRFEFRAVGSQQNCAAAMIVINTAMAEALTNFKARVDALIDEGVEPMKAILRIVREDIKTCKPIHFDGNGYSDAWKQEAARRGLDVETCAPIILDQYLAPATVEMFSKMNVLTKAELQARNEIKLDTYIKKIQIEARILGDICMNHIIPVATRYQTQLIDNVHKMADIFPAETAERLNGTNMSLIKQIGEHNTFVIENVERLIEARRVANRIKNDRERAIAYHDTVAPLIEEIRSHVDQLELIVDDELWPLPKYREMLFIH